MYLPSITIQQSRVTLENFCHSVQFLYTEKARIRSYFTARNLAEKLSPFRHCAYMLRQTEPWQHPSKLRVPLGQKQHSWNITNKIVR